MPAASLQRVLLLKKKKVLQTITSINHQRIFGTDVLSRIDIANQGRLLELQRTILNDLSVSKSDYPDNYYPDLSEDNTYYPDIMTAVVYGLIM